ncbi:MAG: hypothetical protein ACOYIP_06860 [Coriobacteriales bacterium]|jgi:hypothetical protein
MKEPIEERRSVFNPKLGALIDRGVVNPKYEEDCEYIKYAICSSDDAEWAAEATAKLPEEQQTELADFGDDPDYRYLLATRLIELEWNEDVLVDAALHNPDPVLRRGAYSRLTGWSHLEEDPARAHITYSCDPLETVANKRLTDLCEALIATEGQEDCDEMLVAAARELSPKLEWERAARAAGILEGSVLDRCGEHEDGHDHDHGRVSCAEHDHDHDIDLSAWDNA